jgi:hypothetical protein
MTGWGFDSTSLSGGNSIALGATTTGNGTGLGVRTGVGCATVMRVDAGTGDFSRSKVIGVR